MKFDEDYKAPTIGKATKRESELIDYLGECLTEWVKEHNTERRELIAALFSVCVIVFTTQTPFNVEGQCAEIDDFCHYLKEKAKERCN